uniref:Protein kinase putative n=1 Tax=Albugo laibachii Nc14 TaxID=890382 RepID=F0WPJ7_9STRA|nr:protein kinase putative [Albugo laibachii Nc14]|eukprot:CCA23247.1 protein kinase putative [Albugo laibachii Nc14]
MVDFDAIDGFNEHAVQGKPIKAYRNGIFENPKTLFIQHHWSWDEFLCAASQRLEMVPMASRVFNADGAELDDIMCVEENDLLFFSTGMPFKAPTNKDDAQCSVDDRDTVVSGYKVGALLGRGGFGEVRLGTHQLTNDKVALKFILKSEMGSLGDVERTTTEIQCLTALNHPNIIKLNRVVNEPNHVVLLIELLEGGDLFHYLRNVPGGYIAEEEGVDLFNQILAGVGYAHNQHICHRDLKLENILLSNKNDISMVKIADFGLSDFYKPGAMMKTSCGSLSYLAPEVFRGTSNAGPPLDVWSLGVILYAILCGRLPFEGTDLQGSNRPRENVIRSRIMQCQYKLDDHVSSSATDLIAHMLKLDPNERATIPEIFTHSWVRGISSTTLAINSLSIQPSPSQESESEDEDEAEVTLIAHSTIKSAVASNNTAHDEKLPSIVSKSPQRQDNTGAGSTALAFTGLGTNTTTGATGRLRLNRLESTRTKVEKSPRSSPTSQSIPAALKILHRISPTHLQAKRLAATNVRTRSQTSSIITTSAIERVHGLTQDSDRPLINQQKSFRRRPDMAFVDIDHPNGRVEPSGKKTSNADRQATCSSRTG